ncbi:MAG: FAD-binding oxidoreductase, partial [Desulfomonilaceae bacterium]
MSENTKTGVEDNNLKTDPVQPASDATDVTRRGFLASSLTVVGSLLVGQSVTYSDQLPVKAGAHSTLDVSALRKIIKGRVLTKSDADFEKVALNVWNKYGNDNRRPQLIVRVADEHDVIEAVRYARTNKLKIAVRGGGHNWCNPSLRNGGMMIDLTNLNRVISIDPKTRKAVVQPMISNREIQRQLNALHLSYPSGHCPPVKLSGYVLGGGM